MKRIVSILLAVLIMVTFGACSNSKETAGSGENPVITWLLPGDKQPDLESVMAEVNKIAKEKIGAELDIQFIDVGSFGERMKMKMAAGEAFDLCFTGYVNDYISAVNNGGLMDITEMIEAHPGLKAAIPEYAWRAATLYDKIWAVPNLQVMASKLSIFVDKAVADKYDFDWSKVTHIRDIEPFLEMVKEGEPGRYPYRSYYGLNPWTQTKWISLDGGYAIARDGSSKKIVLMRDTDEFKEGQATSREWYKKGYIRRDVLSVTDDTTDFNAGKYVVFVSSSKPGAKEIMEVQMGKELISVDITEPLLSKPAALSTMIGVGANSKNAEKAVEFIELINTDKELYNLICFGIKDKHYTLNDEGKVVYVENSGYAPKADWMFGNQFNALLTEGLADDVWEETAKLNLEATPSPLLEFQFDKDPVKTELSQYAAVTPEYSAMNSGADDPSNYMDEYIKRCEAAGQKKIGEELQKQIDAFFAGK